MIGIKKKAAEEKIIEEETQKDSKQQKISTKDDSGVAFVGVRKKGFKKKNKKKKRSPGEIRVQKDISELDGGNCAVADFPDPNNLMKFNVTGKFHQFNTLIIL